jgi:hypothetical protein
MKEQNYFCKVKLYEGEMAVPNRMSLRLGFLWLILNLTLIIQP